MVELLQETGLGWECHGFLTRLDHDGEPDPAIVLPGGRLALVKQVHSAVALTVSASFGVGERPEADAMASNTPGIVLGIVTADCAPVLFADPEQRIIGAAHAGWRGAYEGVLEATVEQMITLGANRDSIRATIGPTIAQASYQVDNAFRQRLLAQNIANELLFTEDSNPQTCDESPHFLFDLPAYVQRRLTNCGIKTIVDLKRDTYAESARFHSFRRATHQGAPTYGRQYSLIGLPG